MQRTDGIVMPLLFMVIFFGSAVGIMMRIV
jgi:hypothetical protein